jgi:hypothetical protein
LAIRGDRSTVAFDFTQGASGIPVGVPDRLQIHGKDFATPPE